MAICLKTNQRVALKIMNEHNDKDSDSLDIIKYDTKVVKCFLN